MTYVETVAGRIRKLDQSIKLRFTFILFSLESMTFLPIFLPLLFYLFRIIIFHSRLKFKIARGTGEEFYVSDIGHAGDIHNHSLQP